VATAQPESAPLLDTPADAPVAEPSPADAEEAAEPTLPAVEETTTAAEPTPAAVAAEPVAAGGVTIYQISQADSQVRFELDEDLRGQRITVVGVTNLPARANIGETISFAIAGELTIRNISQPVLFTVIATAVSDSQINGTASTVISRGDFNLVIPNVPSIANVEEEVGLYIDFVARRS
jgi:hypothetical protein